MPALGIFFLALVLWNLTPELQGLWGLDLQEPVEGWLARGVWPLVSLTLLPALVFALLLWPESFGRRGSRPLTSRRLARAQIAGSLTALVAWTTCLTIFDWAGTVNSLIPVMAYGMTLAVSSLPLLTGLALMALPEARALGLRRPRALRAEMWTVLRPNLIILLPFMVIQGLEEWIRLNPDRFLALSSLWQVILVGFPVLLILGLAPWLFGKVLRSLSLPEGEMKQRFLALCQKSGLRDVEPQVWQTGQRPMANAMMTGLLPYQRRVFMTDVLLESLTQDEQDAVLAHELAHARRHHLWLYLAFAGAMILWAGLVDVWIQEAIPSWVTPGLFLLLFFFSFRRLSHHMEHEADLYSETLSEKPGSIIQALLQLRQNSRRSLEKSSWRHPSILQRIRTLHAHRADADFRQRFDGRSLWFRRLILAALIGGAGLLAWQTWESPQVETWQVRADEALDHLFAIEERRSRPSTGFSQSAEREQALILAAEEKLVQSVADLRSRDPRNPSLSPLLLQLAEIYELLDQPWNALACRLQARRIPSSTEP